MSIRIRAILFLFVYLAVVYNLDKLGLLVGINLALYPLLYIVMTIAVFGIIAITGAIKIPRVGHIAGWAAVYLLGRWLFYPQSPFWMGTNIYQTVTEITLLAVAVILAYHLADQLHKIDELGRIISLPSTVRQVRNFSSSLEDIKVEFGRSRRYNHPLSLMVIEPSQFTLKEDLDRIILENQKRISRRILAARLAEIIIHQTRRIDMIMTKNWDGRFIILCPEDNTKGANKLAQRIQSDVKTNLGVSIQYGIAAFPSDALTLEDLLRHAETNLTSTGQVAYLSGQTVNKPGLNAPAAQALNEINEGISSPENNLEVLPDPSHKIIHKDKSVD
ncbi:MAG: hypothetical protein P4L50_18335 [Anaerolineaceae bacterium]|nr:hypothetical protein [Anaerolineaceae bacterium]